MTKEQQMVKEFHEKFKCEIRHKPTVIHDMGTVFLRFNLIKEELLELFDAMISGDLIGVADGLADLKYVVEGTAVTYGIDLEPVFEEVHRSNMTKTGGGKRADGKVLKGKGYSAPDIKKVLDEQIGGL